MSVKKRTRKGLRLLLLAVFLVSTALMLRQFADNAGGSDAYHDALAIASASAADAEAKDSVSAADATQAADSRSAWVPAPVEDEDPNMEQMAAIGLDALREVNEDVIGWIMIPDSNINYPLLQGDDNDHYLEHAWDNRSTSVGSIFLEHLSSADLTDYNTIVYGHNMNDGSMFAGLKKYSTDGYWEKHPYVYIATDEGVYRYEIFSAYKAEVDSVTYCLSFRQEKTKAEFLLHTLDNSKIDTGILPELTDRILTLSTCSGMGQSTRWVVHARLRMVEVEP